MGLEPKTDEDLQLGAFNHVVIESRSRAMIDSTNQEGPSVKTTNVWEDSDEKSWGKIA